MTLKSPSWLKRLSRFSGWVLLPLMLLQFLSGYAILHPRIFGGFLAKPTAFKLHAIIQPITAAAFVLHEVPFLRGVFRKRGLSGLAVDIPLFLTGGAFLASVVYLRVLG